MTTLVLGHLVLDEIHAWDGSVYRAAGGITFPLGTLAALAGVNDAVLPVFPYGRDAGQIMRESEDRFPGMSTRHCWEVEQGTTCVRLFHESPAQYNTQLVRSLPPIPHQRYEPLLESADLVYLNMMTGEDILLSDASRLRGSGRLVYIDLHMIAYRVHSDGRREPAPSEHWKRWIAAGDMVQCNEREFDALTGTDHPREERARSLMEESSLQAFVLTRGENGADVYPASGSSFHVPAIPPGVTTDPTGCGDAFGATFAWEAAKGCDLRSAAAKASRAAAFVVTLPGSKGLEGLRAHLEEEQA
jgi:sugar/nucleoside kinase (ribokinase family)